MTLFFIKVSKQRNKSNTSKCLRIKSNIQDTRAILLNVLKIKALKLLSSVSNIEILYLN